MELHDIGWAVDQLKHWNRVTRTGWNGKGMWLALHSTDPDEVQLPTKEGMGYSRANMTKNFVYMQTADYQFIPWLCSQADLLAIDWELVS